MNTTAILIDTVSIQPYLFGSNKLRENIGASHIVGECLFKQLLPMALECPQKDERLSNWHEFPGTIAMGLGNPPPWEVAYEGGGNAMLLFRTPALAEEFIRKFTALVILNFPGLRVAIGVVPDIPMKRIQEDFPAVQRDLHDALRRVRHLSHPNNLLPKDGVMDDCPQSNEAATECLPPTSKDGKDQWVGRGTKVKLDAAVLAQSEWRSKFPRFAGSKFAFTSEIEKLGQPEDKGYVAIVHIDGNGIGKRFVACKSLPALRQLSSKVSQQAEKAMDETLYELVALLPLGSELREELRLEQYEGRELLPLRPLWMGGDDVVFVCEGRLGIYLANRYIQNFCRLMNADQDAEPVSACAGVAIVKTKYPFYRAFKLAEDLMSQAKKKSKEKGENKSWLAFLVSSAGFNGDLDEILDEQYKIGELSLYGGPYCLDKNESQSIRDFFHGLQAFEKWPRNKVMELRDVLVKSADQRAYFVETLRSRGLKLPHDAQVIDAKVIGTYMDMIHWFPFHLQPLVICN